VTYWFRNSAIGKYLCSDRKRPDTDISDSSVTFIACRLVPYLPVDPPNRSAQTDLRYAELLARLGGGKDK
jgi:hypothetical protein